MSFPLLNDTLLPFTLECRHAILTEGTRTTTLEAEEGEGEGSGGYGAYGE